MHIYLVDRESTITEDTNEKPATETIPKCRGTGSTTGTHENRNLIGLSELSNFSIPIKVNFQCEITPQTQKLYGGRCSTSSIHGGHGAAAPSSASADTKSEKVTD